MQRKASFCAPYHEQVASILRAQVLGMGDGPPVQLPSERDLCRTYHAARNTVRQALQVLETDGLIRRTLGKGTFTEPAGIRAWLRMRGSKRLVVITFDTAELQHPLSYYGRIYQGIARRCHQAEIALSIQGTGGTFPAPGPEQTPEDPQTVIGAIIVGVRSERIIAMHAKAGYPVVCVDYWCENLDVDVVVVDCLSDGMFAAKLLLSQGHRSFFYVGKRHGQTGDNQPEVDSDVTLAGFQRMLRMAGVPLASNCIRHCHLSREDEIVATARWFANMKARPTAGLFFSTHILSHFLQVLPDYGLSCPRDVSLIGRTIEGPSLGNSAALVSDPLAIGTLAVERVMERASQKQTVPIVQAVRSRYHSGATVRCL